MGGSKLESYELQYIEPISEEEQDVGKDSKKTRMEKRIVKIEPQKTSYRLGNLRGGHTYLNFMLTARNVHGISSIPSTCGDVCTKQSSRADDLRKELKWARSSLFNHIDSDFLTGVIQREDKQFYIQKLETELDSIAQQDNDSCRNDVYDSSNDDLGQNDGNKESEGVPTMSTRYKQFEFRINAIEESISARYQEIESTNSKRFFLSKQIKILEERANEIKTELQRISDFDDQIFVTSDVMHDSEQRFQVVDLKSSLSKELVTSSSQMETWKNEIVQGDGRIALLQEWIEESKEKLMERRAAFFLFQKKQRRSSLLEYHSNRSNEELMKLCIVSWSKIAKEGIFKTKRMAEFSYYIRLYLYRNALTKWKICTSAFKQFENTKIQTSTIVGKAGRCLLKNEIGRLDAKVSLQHTLTNLKEDSAKTIWDDLYDPKVWNEHGLFGIVLGDHYFDRDDAARAIKCYLSLPPIVESLNVEETAKMQYLNIIELKIANAARVLGSYSKATLYFESVLLRSNAMGTNRITALAHLGLGDVYMHTREYATAQDHFSLALCVSKEDEALSSLSTLTGQLLERCLLKDNRSHISDIIAPSTQDLRKTVAHEIARVDELKSRLTHAGGLRLGCITPIENAPITLVQIRMRREDIKATIQQKEDELNQIREDVEELAVLIKRIEGEISGAKTTNGRTSSLVHDNPQIFQDQELREKLSLRLSESKLKFKQFQEKQNQLTIDIKNLRDEDVELDERARIEECPLMSKVLSRRKIRLMAFDRRSGGNLVAVTIERDIYLHDLMDGKALVVFTGGESSSSSGKSIGGHTKTITTLLFYGEKIFSGSMDKSLICWSIDKKTLIFKAFGHSGTITSISIHDSLLLTGSTDKSVIIWSSHDGQILKQLRGHSRGILGLATWPSYFASADADGEIQIWNHEVRICVI